MVHHSSAYPVFGHQIVIFGFVLNSKIELTQTEPPGTLNNTESITYIDVSFVEFWIEVKKPQKYKISRIGSTTVVPTPIFSPKLQISMSFRISSGIHWN